jgi:type IV fimbrial biogenesis protein FimT
MRGVTFIELMTTLLVVAIVAAIALPGFADLARSNRAAAQTSLLQGAFNYARSEAVRRNVEVHITSLSGDKNWGASGWRIWADKDKDGLFSANDDELRVQPGLTGGATLTAPDIAEIVFAGTGFLRKQAGATFATSFVFNFRIPDHCNFGRDITLMYAGRVSMAAASCTP